MSVGTDTSKLSALQAAMADLAQLEAAPAAVTYCFADIMPQSIAWLWPGRIARGKLTIVAGEPGLGKSFLLLDIAARCSTGSPLPGETERPELMSTLLLAVEDDPADTIRPRLDALQAKVSRIHLLAGVKDSKGEHLPSLDRDYYALQEAIERLGIGLVIVDPINAYMGKTDGKSDIDVRSVLTPLTIIAQNTQAAVIAVMHLNKDEQKKALNRVTGSMAYVGAARSVLGVGVDPGDPARRVVVQLKNNLAQLAQPLAFRIVKGAVQWDKDPVSVTAETVFGGLPTLTERSGGSALGAAIDFLQQALGPGKRPAKAVAAEATKEFGISPATLRRARQQLSIKSTHDGFGDDVVWYWELPETAETGPDSPEPDEDVDEEHF